MLPIQKKGKSCLGATCETGSRLKGIRPQARLLLYKLIADKLTDVQRQLLSANPELWEHILEKIEEELEKQPIKANSNLDELVLTRIFSFIERSTVLGLERQLKFVAGEKLWLGSHNPKLLESFIEEHKRLLKSV